jgi:beta-lactamase class A/beta-lactamase class A VEB
MPIASVVGGNFKKKTEIIKQQINMTRLFQLVILLFLLTSCKASNKKIDFLGDEIQQIISDKKAIVGVSVIGDDGKDTISINGDKHFPMQSVFKLHIALAVLSEIDKGRLSLDKEIKIDKKDLLPDLYSPIRDKYPDGATLPISEILDYTVSASDNVGCEVLLRLIGGPKVVEEYCKKNGINDVSIKYNEEEQQANWDLQFQNWTTPKAANQLLEKFYYNKNNLLSQKNYDFVWKIMQETKTGKERLKGLLPSGIILAHKTGSSGTNKEGLTAAVNDIGIVFLPNGKHVFISVFVTNSKENAETNEKIIADIAKATYEFYTTETK